MTDAQYLQIVGLLAEIRDELAYLCRPVDADEGEPEPGCDHPEERRTDFSSPRETHWTCGVCGHVERQEHGTRAPALPPSASAEE
jgi:hypothetical protein